MKADTETGANGVKAARALLGLLDEHSAEDFEAAELILSGQSELLQIVRLLREFKEKQSGGWEEPVTVEGVREIVKHEIMRLSPSRDRVIGVALHFLGAGLRTLRNSKNATVEDLAQGLLQAVDDRFDFPSERVEGYITLLRELAPSDEHAEIESQLRDLAIRAVAENLLVLPNLHAIAHLRKSWAPTVLPYRPEESRKHLAARLFKDAARLAPDKLPEITLGLLKEGLRSPVDLSLAQMRRSEKKKAHGE